MPRKKRARRKETEDDVNTFPSKRRHTENKEEPLVISDSENEEEYKPTREDRMRARESRAQNKEMTEEEMLDLAMRLSEQEAGNAALRQQQEEEAMRKAIAESLQANGTEANKDNTESLSVLRTPTRSSQTSPGQSPPPASESPVFLLREKPSLSSHCKARGDPSTEDQFTTATVTDKGENRKPATPLCHISLSQPLSPEPPLVPPHSPEKENRSSRKDADSEPQDCSSECHFQPESSPVFPKSPCHRPVLCIEKLSQDLLVDCYTTGFVLCSRKDPPSVTASGRSQSSTQGSASPPESPTFPRMDRREDETVSEGRSAQRLQEPLTTTGSHRAGDIEHCETSPRRPCCYPSGRGSSESASVMKTLSDGVDQDQSKEQPCHGSLAQKNKQKASEDVLDGTAGGTQPNKDFPTQMTLYWSDEEDDKEEGNADLGQKKDQANSPPESQNAVCDQNSPSDSESLLKVGLNVVPSPVFRRETACSKSVLTGASLKPTPPANRLSPLTPTRAGGSGARGVRRKFTFRNMYALEAATSSDQNRPVHSAGGRTKGSPSSQGQDCTGQLGPSKKEQGEGTVLYYWGVPFCPRGQNPDDYTQVILSQLEVYEKSLKEARRGLLRKAEWGEPVLPGPPKKPFSRRGRLKRHRAPRPLDEEEDDEETQIIEEVEETGEEERADSHKGLEEREGRGHEVRDSEASGVPSPQPVQEKSPQLFRKEETPEKLAFLRRRGLRERSPAESETQLLEEEEEEEEEGMCPETQMSEDNTCDLPMESPAGSQPKQECEEMEMEMEMEVVGDENGPAPEEEEGEEEARMEVEVEEEDVPEPVAQTCSERVECPICMQSFPLSQIEMHAAYCDGATEERVPTETHSQVMILRKSSRRAESTDEDQPGSSGSSNRAVGGEKCYVCQGVFPVREYAKHVEACISHRSTSGRELTKNLLTALDQSEQRDPGMLDAEAGPSHSTFKSKEQSRHDAQGSGGSDDAVPSGFTVSTSPIRSFTPISEATDCLIDFKHQYSSKPTQRAGRKRKFKR